MRESKPLGLILLFVFFGLIGQYLYKAGVAQPEMSGIIEGLHLDWQQFTQGQLGAVGQMVLHSVLLVINPYCFAGLVAYALSTVCWLAILSKVDLSFAYPMISIGYVAVLLMGAFVFGEEVTMLRWLGVMLIGIGIISIFSEEWFGSHGLVMAGVLAAAALVLLGTGHSVKPAEHFEKPVLFLAVTLSLGIIGQILFKMGMNREVNKERVKTVGGNVKDVAYRLLPEALNSRANKNGCITGNSAWKQQPLFPKVAEAAAAALRLFFSPYVFAGLAAYALSTILWVMLLKVVPLSFLYPLLSVGYVVILLVSVFAFHERVSFLRWYGVIMICYGIVVIFSEDLISRYLPGFVSLLALLALFLYGYVMRQRRKSSAA